MNMKTINMTAMALSALLCLATVAAQATEVYITLDDVRSAVTYDYISANGYFIYSDTLSQSDAVAAFSSAGASYESTIASSAALTRWIEEGFWSEYEEVSDAGAPMYALCFDQDNNNNYMYVSPVASYDPDDESYFIDALDTSNLDTSDAAAKLASEGWQGAGWYSVATSSVVPEPTSGLLMLLGVAGLALKRKRA